jgi:predicted transposase/invertase (TIGR01784 family)
LLDAVNILFVELSKMKRVMKKPVSEMTGAEMWAIFLACANNPKYGEILRKIIEAREEIKVAYELLTNISQDADERARFRARRKFQMDLEHNQLVSFDNGKREGKLEGKREREFEIARSLLASGVPLNIIVQSTGLSLDKVQSLKNND